jgi:transposase InsO family protein
VDWAIKEKCHSQRRACAMVGIAPRVYRYGSIRPDDTAIRKRLRELASERRRFGYRRLHILLKREGIEMNLKKLYRLYKEERLAVRTRWPQAGARQQNTDGYPAGAEPALVPGLCLGRPDGWPALSHPLCHR